MPPNRARRSLIHFAVSCLALCAASAAAAADLTVEIDGLRSDKGVIMLGLYDTAETFDMALKHYEQPDGFIKDTGRVLGAAIRVDTGIRRTTLTGLKPGKYAIILFHDENQDGRLDKNIFGVPTEGFGFSNNVLGFLSPPDFEDALLTVGDDAATTRIELQY